MDQQWLEQAMNEFVTFEDVPGSCHASKCVWLKRSPFRSGLTIAPGYG